jgi:DNA-binding NarL/FixJ family response regulator
MNTTVTHPGPTWTERRLTILTLVATGLTYQRIGDRLGIKRTTVKTHVDTLRLMLGAKNRADLIVRAYRAGLFDDEEAT